jgi:hypothetical protein
MDKEVKYHIGFGRADLGENPPTLALLSGDPERARRIAQEHPMLTFEKKLSENRGLNSYIARLPSGRRIISATSGMGAPSLSIVVNELAQLGVRVVWETRHDDIVDLHLHPKDATAAIVAVDVTTPPGSWRWGGPAWEGRIPDHRAGGITSITVAAADPATTTQRWAGVLGVVPTDPTSFTLAGGEQQVRVVQAADENAQGVVAVTLTGHGGGSATVGGVDLHMHTGSGME